MRAAADLEVNSVAAKEAASNLALTTWISGGFGMWDAEQGAEVGIACSHAWQVPTFQFSIPPPPLPESISLSRKCKRCQLLTQENYTGKQWKKGLEGKGACCVGCSQAFDDENTRRKNAAAERGKTIRHDMQTLGLTVTCAKCRRPCQVSAFHDNVFRNVAVFRDKNLRFGRQNSKVDPLTISHCSECRLAAASRTAPPQKPRGSNLLSRAG